MPDTGAQRQRRYRERHPERHPEACRRWRQRNRLHVVQYGTLKHAREQLQATRQKAEEHA